MKNLSVVIIGQFLIYLLQYIIVPMIFKLEPSDSSGNSAMIIVTTAIVSIVVMYQYLDQFRYWFISSPLYYILVEAYHPEYIYGIDYIGIIPLAKKEIYIIALLVLITQFIVWVIVKIIKFCCHI